MSRSTRQREAIQSVLASAGGPLSPQEIRDSAQKLVPGLGIATVYRLLKLLVEEQTVTVVEISGSATRYENAARPHHHHFFCRECGVTYDLMGCFPGVDKLAPKNFEVEKHEITLFGRCEACATSAGKKPGQAGRLQ